MTNPRGPKHEGGAGLSLRSHSVVEVVGLRQTSELYYNSKNALQRQAWGWGHRGGGELRKVGSLQSLIVCGPRTGSPRRTRCKQPICMSTGPVHSPTSLFSLSPWARVTFRSWLSPVLCAHEQQVPSGFSDLRFLWAMTSSHTRSKADCNRPYGSFPSLPSPPPPP